MMKIYEVAKCFKKDCENNAICLYSGVWICGKCLEALNNKENKRKQELMLQE